MSGHSLESEASVRVLSSHFVFLTYHRMSMVLDVLGVFLFIYLFIFASLNYITALQAVAST